MASVVSENAGRRLIQLSPSEHPNRPKIRIGKVSKRDAETVRVHIEKLLRANMTGSTMPPATATWLAGIPASLQRRLQKFGIIESSKRKICPTVAEWIKKYIEGRTDIKPNTKRNMEQAQRSLIEFFGKTRRLDEVTVGDTEDFRIYLKAQGLAEATIRRRCKRAKQLFTAAVRKEIISKSPFADMKCGTSCNPERFYFVGREDIKVMLNACPDDEWRLIFALARYGGIRIPSEAFLLTWADINFDEMRFTVRSPKTEHQGKGSRLVPIFPELYPLLLKAFENAEEGAVYVITKYRDPKQNLRTQAHRIIQRAGLEPWPKTFQNMRSTRETELAEEYPVQVVCQWIGNSPQVAARHYLQVTEDHFKKAVQDPVQTTHDKGRKRVPEESAGIGDETQVIDCQCVANSGSDKHLQPIPPRGLERNSVTTLNSKNLHNSQRGVST